MNTEFIEVKNRAAQRRAQQAHRDELIAELGWAPEGKGDDRYLASSAELTRWVNEKRVKAGLPELPGKVFSIPHTLWLHEVRS